MKLVLGAKPHNCPNDKSTLNLFFNLISLPFGISFGSLSSILLNLITSLYPSNAAQGEIVILVLFASSSKTHSILISFLSGFILGIVHITFCPVNNVSSKSRFLINLNFGGITPSI